MFNQLPFGFGSNGNGGGGGGGTLNFIALTYADAQALIAGGTLVPGSFYKITDRGDLGILLQATSTTTLTVEGVRYMQCPFTYMNITIHGEVWLGVWRSTLTPSVGDLAIWGGLVWRNTTGSVGSVLDNYSLEPTDWDLVPKAGAVDTVYLPLQFPVKYDFDNDWIAQQTDENNNVIGYSYDYAVTYIGDSAHNPVDLTDWNMTERILFTGNQVPWGIYNNTAIISRGAGASIVGNKISDGAIVANRTSIISNNKMDGDISGNTSTANDATIAGNIVFGRIGENINCLNILNNICGSITQNTVQDITDNICPSVTSNNMPAFVISKNKMPFNISQNTITGSILYNVCDGTIQSNGANVTEISYNYNTGEIANNDNVGMITLNSNDGSISGNTGTGSITSNLNNGFINTNSCADIVANKNAGNITDNTNGGSITNNSNGGSIDTNANQFQINNNSCVGAISTNGANVENISNNFCQAIFNNNNAGNIYNNMCNGFIGENVSPVTGITYNSNRGDIYQNQNTGLISKNSNGGDINGNLNNGDISFNDNNGRIFANTATVVYILNNQNNGDIRENSASVGNIGIVFNTNNGEIFGAFAADVTDPVVNKN